MSINSPNMPFCNRNESGIRLRSDKMSKKDDNYIINDILKYK